MRRTGRTTHLLARYSQIDYDREMTFIALPEDESDGMFGEVRAVCDPDNLLAKFAIQVATDCQRRGISNCWSWSRRQARATPDRECVDTL